MSTFLIKTVEIYRADSEAEATQLIEEAKRSNKYILNKSTSTLKERKQKGEIVDSWYRVELHKIFDDEKEPIGDAEIKYTTGGDFDD